MIILIDGVRYQLVTPENEDWLEQIVQANSEHIFGPDSFYFDRKKLIRSKAGVASIPDGYVISFMPKAQWAVVEVELAAHPLYEHIFTQLSKFNKGIEDSTTRKQLADLLYGVFDEDEVLKAKLKQKIGSGEVYKFISDVTSRKPLIVVIIDEKTEELEEAVEDIRGDVRIVEFKTFRREGTSEGVNVFVFEPLNAGPITPPRPEGEAEPKSAAEPGFSGFRMHKAKAESTRVTRDSRTFELVRDNPHRFSEEEIYQIISEEFPGSDPETLRDTMHRRLHGHLDKKLGVHIQKDAAGKYYIE